MLHISVPSSVERMGFNAASRAVRSLALPASNWGRLRCGRHDETSRAYRNHTPKSLRPYLRAAVGASQFLVGLFTRRIPYASLKAAGEAGGLGGALYGFSVEWYHHRQEEPAMAKKKTLSKRQQRKIRMRRVIFGVIAVIVIASFIVSLVA